MGQDLYLTQTVPFGIAGLDLKRTKDSVPPSKLTIMTNVDRTEEGRLRLRKGQQVIASTSDTPLPKTDPLVNIDEPLEGQDVQVPFTTRGWAIDRRAVEDAGVDFVDVWAFPGVNGADGEADPAVRSFLGRFSIEIPRSGVADQHGDNFLISGFAADVERALGGTAPLTTGPYELRYFVHSTVTGTFVITARVDVQIIGISATAADRALALVEEPPAPAVPTVFEPTGLSTARPRPVAPTLRVREELKGLDVPELLELDPAVPHPIETLADELLSLGVDAVRVEFLEAADGKIDLALYDALTRILADRSIRVVGVISSQTVSGTSSDWPTSAYHQRLARRARSLASRYDGILDWELWPRPDAAATRLEPVDLAGLLSSVGSAIRDVSSSAQIVLGGIAEDGLQQGENYLRDLYDAVSTPSWDVVGLSPNLTTLAGDLVSVLARAREVMRDEGDAFKKIWLLGVGLDTRSVSERDQAQGVQTFYEDLDVAVDGTVPHAGPIVERIFFASYRDGEEALFGLVDAEGRRKEAYQAYLRLGAPATTAFGTSGPPLTAAAREVQALASAQPASGPEVHSLFRLDDPRTGDFARIVGVEDKLYFGRTGALSLIDQGYSGTTPIHFVAADPAVSDTPWAYLANRARMRKVRVDGLSLPIGLPAPVVAASADLAPEERTIIDLFDSQAGWNDPEASGNFDITPSHQEAEGQVGGAVQFNLPTPGFDPTDPESPRTAPNNFNFWTKRIRLDLSRVGSREATDDDMIHVRIKVNRPARLIDVKLYFVVNPDFAEGRFGLPGGGQGTANTDAYMKAFRRHDFEGTVSMTGSPQEDVADSAQGGASEGELGNEPRPRLTDPRTLVRQAQREKKRGIAEELAPGQKAWTEFGVVDRPLRRGDFLRIGGDDSRDWRHVTGIIIAANFTTEAEFNAFQITFDDMYLTGGYNIDNAEFGAAHYDWRYTDFDPRTGAESNPSPIMDNDSRIDTARRKVVVRPRSSGNPALRQRFYRRGGALVTDWFFVGRNNADGQRFEDVFGDSEIVASATLDLDNDQPVTTIDSAGRTVRAEPLASIWGPIQDMLLGCGDRHRPGHVYWSKPGEPDHWPPQNNIKVTAASEELMAGLVYGSDAYVFSRKRLYFLIPSLSGISGTVHYQPTECQHGLINRWAFTAGYQGIFFVSDDGIYHTRGGTETNLTDDDLEPLFRGESRNGLPPIRPATARLELHENELWFSFKGSGAGARPHVLIYDLVFRYWRHYDFLDGPTVVVSERSLLSAPNLLVMGTAGGLVHRLIGTTDNLVAPEAHVRTGTLNQGAARRDKVYGDLAVDVQKGPESPLGATPLVTVEALADDEATTIATVTLTPTKVKDRHVLDVLKATRARNVALDLTWRSPAVELYFGTLQYLFDEGVERIRWDSEETDHGVGTWHTPLFAHVAIRAEADVTLSVESYLQDGTLTTTTYTIPGSAGLKVKRFVPFEAVKAALFRYRFTSSKTFKLYREETVVVVRAQGGRENMTRPFGDALSVSPAEVANVRGA